jgi:pyruvate/2-oxoglutarate dehydrogenase complex dihydrolipoamide acyltransferase (E2) component
LGYQDAIAPFTGFLNATFMLAMNSIAKQPVVEDGKVVVGDVMQCNFMVDHRYMDGASGTKLLVYFNEVFENP